MTPADRVSIYLPDHIRDALDLRPEAGDSLSGRVAAVIDRYRAIVAGDCPALTRAEWMLVLDALNGWASLAEAAAMLPGGLPLEVFDHIRLNAADEKWGLDGDQARGLVQRLRNLTVGQAVAVVEMTERFWRRTDLPTDQAMAEAGIVLMD